MAELLTKQEIAARLRVSPATILEWVHCGRIPAVRVNARVLRYDEAAVLDALRRPVGGANDPEREGRP
jgi:excisionase family DNA binding protein